MARRKINDDAYTQRARREGYAARSAYKLIEIQDRWKIIRRGDRVLDLGCAPGSWLQVTEKLVGEKGRVAGIDLNPTSVSCRPWVRTAVGDAFTLAPADLCALAEVNAYDVILSDMAPNTTGDPTSDHFHSIRLAEHVLTLTPAILRPGGAMIVKVFEGESYPDYLRAVKQNFSAAKGFRPKATRGASREIFVVARDSRPPAGAQGASEA